MRFTVVRRREGTRVVDYPIALDEEPVCDAQEEYDRIEYLPLHWDER